MCNGITQNSRCARNQIVQWFDGWCDNNRNPKALFSIVTTRSFCASVLHHRLEDDQPRLSLFVPDVEITRSITFILLSYVSVECKSQHYRKSLAGIHHMRRFEFRNLLEI